MSTLRERALVQAAHEHDLHHPEEQPRGSNDGALIRKYLKAAGIGSPAPWCAAFITWAYIESGATGDDLPPVGQRASACNWRNWAKKSGRMEVEPQRGDLFVICNVGTWRGHIGFIAEAIDVKVAGIYDLGDGRKRPLLRGKWLRTLEGNSNDDGSREGYALVRRFRRVTPNLGFIRV